MTLIQTESTCGQPAAAAATATAGCRGNEVTDEYILDPSSVDV